MAFSVFIYKVMELIRMGKLLTVSYKVQENEPKM
jgi:hypothetical protein